MGNFAKFFVCLLVSAAFFLVLYFKFLNNYITSDKTKEACEANNTNPSTLTPVPTTNSASKSSDIISNIVSDSCTMWYNQYGLCLKGVKDDKGTCQQKNLLIPAGLIFGGLFFLLFAIMSLF